MRTLDLNQVLALLSVVVAATVLNPTGVAIVLALVIGLLCNGGRERTDDAVVVFALSECRWRSRLPRASTSR